MSARSLYRNAARSDSDELYECGWQFLRQQRYDQAMVQFNRLLQRQPANAGALNHLGFCLHAMGRLPLAFKSYQLAQRLAPHDVETLQGLANCYETQGEFETACQIYDALLATQPDNAQWLYNRVMIGHESPDSQIASRLRALHRTATISAEARALICFALGHLYEAANDLNRAFAYYAEANQLSAAVAAYDEQAVFEYLDQMGAAFDARFLSQSEWVGSGSERPIFVVGMPRSGTSLVEQILASHPEVHGAGELHTLPDMVTRLIPQHTGSLDPHAICKLDCGAFSSLAEHYLKVLASHDTTACHVVDKMPNNFIYIGVIRLLFPNARIIHCVRDPMDNGWSLYRCRFQSGHGYSYDQRELGRYYRRYQRLMQHWKRVAPDAIYDIRYEALIENPRREIAALLAHCHLPWEERCLSFHQTKRAVNTASMVQVRQPLYRSSLQSWQPVAEQLSVLQHALSEPL